MQTLRMKDAEKERNALKESIIKMSTDLNVESAAHALKMHTLNKDMFMKSKDFEESFRAAVHRAYRSHNQEALKQLSELHRESLKETDRLRDEIEIQRLAIECLQGKIFEYEEETKMCMESRNKCDEEIAKLRTELSCLDKVTLSKVTDTKIKSARRASCRRENDLTVNTTSEEVKHLESYASRIKVDPEFMKWRNRYNGVTDLRQVVCVDVGSTLSRMTSLGEQYNSESFNTFNNLLAADPEFKFAMEPLFDKLDTLSVTTDRVSVRESGLAWYAYNAMHLWIQSGENAECVTEPSPLVAWRTSRTDAIVSDDRSDRVGEHWYSKTKRPLSNFESEFMQSTVSFRKSQLVDAGREISLILSRSSISLPVIGNRSHGGRISIAGVAPPLIEETKTRMMKRNKRRTMT
jgi:hypothetical protein